MRASIGIVLMAGSIAALLPAAIHTGPEVGAKFPDFEAADQNGRTHKLASLLGPKGAVLVIYRSADW
jgi:AhpC/TSA family